MVDGKPAGFTRTSPSRLQARYGRIAGIAGACMLALSLVACVAPPIVTTPPAASTAEAAQPADAATASLVLRHTDDAIMIPDAIPAGLRRVTIENAGADWHASIIRRLQDDVTMEQFVAAFQENPFESLPLTVQLGGPDLPPGAVVETAFDFTPGQYVVVDNWTAPPRMQPFTVTPGDTADDPAPEAAVTVEMREHEFVMPATLAAGRQWWEFRNTGDTVHQVGIIRLAPDATVDDIVAWLDSEDGPPPWDDIAFWNVMSPGEASWGEIELPPGDFLVLDFLPDFANDGAANFALGMLKEITVTE